MISREAFGVIRVECSRIIYDNGDQTVLLEFSNIKDEDLAQRLAMFVNQLLRDYLREFANEVILSPSREAH